MSQKKSYSGIMRHTKGDYHYAVCEYGELNMHVSHLKIFY